MSSRVGYIKAYECIYKYIYEGAAGWQFIVTYRNLVYLYLGQGGSITSELN